MSELETIQEGNTLDVWKKTDQIRKVFAPDLTPVEFKMFLGLGASLGANPFNREIWAVKYGNSPAQIFLGRDFYRRKAQEQSEYNGHQVDSIYSGDKFKMVGGKPEHEYNLMDRGKLIGAYCVVYRSNNEPFFITVKFDEYDSGKALWKTKPETMIKKVAEAQALRGAFQGLFEGTYDESEHWKELGQGTEYNEWVPGMPENYKEKFPFDKTIPKTKDGKRYWLTDGTEEFRKLEDAVRSGEFDPKYLTNIYAGYEHNFRYFYELVEELKEIDEATYDRS